MKAKSVAARRKQELAPPLRSPRRPTKRASARDLFELASRKWRHGERLEIVQLANELGVARATVFRWVGSRELLYGEVISAAYARQRAHVLRSTRGTGLDRLVRVVRRNLHALCEAAPLRRFIEHDPEFAIRVLTSKSSPVQERSTQLEVEFLREVVEEAKLVPLLDLDTLAFIIIRIGEAFLYADVISGRKPEIEKAVSAIRILVSAEQPLARRARAP